MKLHKLPYKKISIYIVVLLLSIIGSIYWNRPNKEHFDCDNKEKLDIINKNIVDIIVNLINKKLEEQTAGLGKGLKNTESDPDQLANIAGANIQKKEL